MTHADEENIRATKTADALSTEGVVDLDSAFAVATSFCPGARRHEAPSGYRGRNPLDGLRAELNQRVTP
jgi:hypothetical protein